MKVISTLYALRSTLTLRKSIVLLTFCACFSLSLFAQTITIAGGCYFGGCTFTKNGTTTLVDGKTRNTYQLASACGGFFSRIIYTTNSGGRWEVQTDGTSGSSAFLGGTILDFHNTLDAYPNPPCLSTTPSSSWIASGCTPIMTTMTGDCQAVLPVELAQFDANTEGSKNHLTWATASEKDNSHFDIERSTDGNSFHNIGQVKGNNKPSSYQYVDASPFTTSYYRLKQVDFDGTTTYSKVISVEQKGKGKGLKVYPTLVSNGILTVDTEGGQLRDYSVTNLLGQQVLSGKTPPSGAGGLDVSALSQGTYVLKVGSEVAKFVKQ